MAILKTEDYTKLLIIQYKTKEKAKDTIELYVKELFADDLPFQIQEAFNIDTAVGIQLDILGKYIGLDRFYSGQDLEGKDFFSMTNYDGDTAQKGMSDYSDFDTKIGEFLTYNTIISNDLTLDDDNYRFLLKLKILQNNSDHSHKSIDTLIKDFFEDEIIPSSQNDMTMVYFVPYVLTEIIKVAIQKDLLPRPMAVGINVIRKQQDKMFGMTNYDTLTESDFKTGFSTYSDYDTKVGETLNYNKIL
jgi:hypothetical protein